MRTDKNNVIEKSKFDRMDATLDSITNRVLIARCERVSRNKCHAQAFLSMSTNSPLHTADDNKLFLILRFFFFFLFCRVLFVHHIDKRAFSDVVKYSRYQRQTIVLFASATPDFHRRQCAHNDDASNESPLVSFMISFQHIFFVVDFSRIFFAIFWVNYLFTRVSRFNIRRAIAAIEYARQQSFEINWIS